MRLRASHRHSLSLSIWVCPSLCQSPPSVSFCPHQHTHFSWWPTGGSATAGGIVIRVNTTILLGRTARLRSKAGLESSLNNWTADCSRPLKEKKKEKRKKLQNIDIKYDVNKSATVSMFHRGTVVNIMIMTEATCVHTEISTHSWYPQMISH